MDNKNGGGHLGLGNIMDLNLISINVDVAVFIQINHQRQGAPPPPFYARRAGKVSLRCLAEEIDDELLRLSSRPINEPANVPVSIPEDVFFGFVSVILILNKICSPPLVAF